MAENSGAVDLFGLPVIEREPKLGRPEHVRTPENANKISLLFAMGRTVKDAALALGITQPTLRKHYFHEVEQREAMLVRLEADQLLRLHNQASDGSVPAAKELLGRLDRAALAKLAEAVAPKRAASKKGKKEQQAEDAANVGGLYEPPPPPADLVN